MKGKKAKLSLLLHSTGMTCFRSRKNALFVLGYHRIKPSADHTTQFDDGVWGPDSEQFTKQIKWLKAHTKIVSEPLLLDILKSDKTDGGPYSVITFDDGYRDNYQQVYPILKALEVPATFFIPSHLVEERCLGWWDLIPYYLKNTKLPEITVNGTAYNTSNTANRAAAITALQQRMKLEACESTECLVENISTACGVAEPSRETQDLELMTWDHIRELAENGMTIGSHTHTHRVLATLPLETQAEEMERSMRLISNKLNKKVRSISFPVGGEIHFSSDSCRIAKSLGYKLVYSFNTGFNLLGSQGGEHIRRFEPYNKKSMFTCSFSFPEIFLDY